VCSPGKPRGWTWPRLEHRRDEPQRASPGRSFPAALTARHERAVDARISLHHTAGPQASRPLGRFRIKLQTSDQRIPRYPAAGRPTLESNRALPAEDAQQGLRAAFDLARTIKTAPLEPAEEVRQVVLPPLCRKTEPQRGPAPARRKSVRTPKGRNLHIALRPQSRSPGHKDAQPPAKPKTRKSAKAPAREGRRQGVGQRGTEKPGHFPRRSRGLLRARVATAVPGELQCCGAAHYPDPKVVPNAPAHVWMQIDLARGLQMWINGSCATQRLLTSSLAPPRMTPPTVDTRMQPAPTFARDHVRGRSPTHRVASASARSDEIA